MSGVGAEYPASSTSASEAANEKYLKNRGPIFIMVTNFPLSFGGPLAVSVFLIVLSAAGENNLETVWRVATGVGLVFPCVAAAGLSDPRSLTVFYFRCASRHGRPDDLQDPDEHDQARALPAPRRLTDPRSTLGELSSGACLCVCMRRQLR